MLCGILSIRLVILIRLIRMNDEIEQIERANAVEGDPFVSVSLAICFVLAQISSRRSA
jgi:hypothetical protein